MNIVDNSQLDFQKTIMQNIMEIKRIFFVALKFSQNFDIHISKLFSLINSLLDQENDIFMNENELEELDLDNFNSLKLSSPLQQSNLDNILQLNYNSADPRVQQVQPQENNNDLFFQTMKEQNNQMQKLIEKGEGNINHLQSMLTQVFQKILENKNKDNSTDDNNHLKYKNKIGQLELELNDKVQIIEKITKEKDEINSQSLFQNEQSQQKFKELNDQNQKLLNQNQQFLQLLQKSSNKITLLKQEIKSQQDIFQDLQKSYYNACVSETQVSENHDNSFSFKDISFEQKMDYNNYSGYHQYLQQKGLLNSSDFMKKNQIFQANIQSQQRLDFSLPSFKESQNDKGPFKNIFYESNSQKAQKDEIKVNESKETADLKQIQSKKMSVVRQSLDKQSLISQREDSIVMMQSTDLNSMRQSHSNRMKNLSMKSDDDSIHLYFQNSYQNVNSQNKEPKSDKGIATINLKDINIEDQETIKF